jgi:hypothetical protein
MTLTKSQVSGKRAHDYIFSADHGTVPYRWSLLGQLLNTGVAKATYTIPVAGYIILYSDYFHTLFSYSKTLPSGGFLSSDQRLHMTYFGSVILLAAYGFYYWLSPPLLRNRKNPYDFVNDILVTHDYSTVLKIIRDCQRYLDSLDFSAVDDSTNNLRQFREHLKTFSQSTFNLGGEVHNAIARVLRFYYNWQDEKLPEVRWPLGIATTIGYALVLLPAFDLLLRVMITIFTRP